MATTTRILDANVNGTVYTSNANSALEALDTCHSGATAPTDEVANGKLWLDTSTTPGILKIYNNATWEVVHSGTVDINGGAIDGATINGTIIGGTTPAAGSFTALTSNGIDDNAASTAVTIDASGNVGIGTASPTTALHVSGGTDPSINITGTGGTATIKSTDRDLKYDARYGTHVWVSNGTTESMRISSGNVLVGKTSDSFSTVGSSYRANGSISATTSSNEVLDLNRLGTDGGIMRFFKNGAPVGSIGVAAGGGAGVPYICNTQIGNTGLYFAGRIQPTDHTGSLSDNTVDLGSSSVRFDDIYATNGTIQTSDRNEKEAIASLTPAEMLVAARLSSSFKNFKWKDAVAEKGLDAARLHSGIIAQDVQDAFTAEGLDAGDYSMFISGTWWETQTDVPAVESVAEVVDEEGNVVTEAVEAKDAYTRTDTYHTLEEAPEGATERTRFGVRYPELLAFVAAYNDQRFLAIEARVAALEP